MMTRRWCIATWHLWKRSLAIRLPPCLCSDRWMVMMDNGLWVCLVPTVRLHREAALVFLRKLSTRLTTLLFYPRHAGYFRQDNKWILKMELVLYEHSGMTLLSVPWTLSL